MNRVRNGLILLLILMATKIQAQDKMILKNKQDTLQVKILEVGVSDIRYKYWPVEESMPVMVEKKERIRKIIFANGTIMKFANDEFSNNENYEGQKTMAAKIDMFAITRKVLSVSFEKSFKPGLSAEVGIGVIGIGGAYELLGFDDVNGGFVRLGVKFINTPSFYMQGMRYMHVLKGGYIRPELMLLYHENYGNFEIYDYYSSMSGYKTANKIKIQGYVGFLNFGKQWVFSDVFCVDLFLGLGVGSKTASYYFDNTQINSSYYTDVIDPSMTGGFGYFYLSERNGGVSICTQAGLKIGMLLDGGKPVQTR